MIDVSGDAGNGTGAGVLPHVPGVGAPTFARGAGGPRRAALRGLAVVIGDVRKPGGNSGGEVTGGTRAGVEERFDGDAASVGVVFDGVVELVCPIGVAGCANDAAEDFEVEHGHQCFAIGFNIWIGNAPEIASFGTGRVLVWMCEMVCTHENAGGFAVVFVADEVRVGDGGAFGGFGPGEGDAGTAN